LPLLKSNPRTISNAIVIVTYCYSCKL